MVAFQIMYIFPPCKSFEIEDAPYYIGGKSLQE